MQIIRFLASPQTVLLFHQQLHQVFYYGKVLVISGKTMVVKSMGSWITKRFSVSKAKDGKIGLSYDLRASTQIIKKLKDDKTLEPANVTFSAFKNDNGMVSSYPESSRSKSQRIPGRPTISNMDPHLRS